MEIYAKDYGIRGLVMPEELSKIICDYARPSKKFRPHTLYRDKVSGYLFRFGEFKYPMDDECPYIYPDIEFFNHEAKGKTTAILDGWDKLQGIALTERIFQSGS